VEVNCAAIPETLVESELFGHVRGAFTDAHGERKGLVERANGGRLFLDEIGELLKPIQAKLLRVLEEGETRKVGSDETTHVDVQVLAAGSVTEFGKNGIPSVLRPDLYYRLSANTIQVPALRDRPTKARLALIEDAFSRAHSRTILGEQENPEVKVDEEVVNRMLDLPYPGNNRELLSLAANMYARAEHGSMQHGKIPEIIRIQNHHAADVLAGKGKPFVSEGASEKFERVDLDFHEGNAFRELLVHLQSIHGTNHAAIARAMLIAPKTLERRIEKYAS